MQAATTTVSVDLERIRRNIAAIRTAVRVPILAVIKADAYGLGAVTIAPAIGELVYGFCVFALEEAVEADLWNRTGKPAIVLGPPASLDPDHYIAHHVRPAVSTLAQARALRRADPLLCVDTGMQRFACPEERIDEVLAAGQIREAFTHAPTVRQARRLVELLGGRGLKLHAAASSLLAEPEAHLDAVRPGLAIYRGAVTVTSPLVEVHETRGPLGYGQVAARRHGVILGGYAAGLRPGPCMINGARRRVLEVGMQSAYVEVGDADRVGDPVVLLGDDLGPDELAAAWGVTAHEALLRLSSTGRREYTDQKRDTAQ